MTSCVPVPLSSVCSWSCVSDADVTPEEAEAQRCNEQASLESVHDFFHSAASGLAAIYRRQVAAR